MPLPLTDERIAILKGHADRGAAGREAYYATLASWGYNYGNLALSVVRNEGVTGRIANNFARDVAARYAAIQACWHVGEACARRASIHYTCASYQS